MSLNLYREVEKAVSLALICSEREREREGRGGKNVHVEARAIWDELEHLRELQRIWAVIDLDDAM